MTNSPHRMRQMLIQFLRDQHTDQRRQPRRAANFGAQMVAKAPRPKLAAALSAAFESADSLLQDGNGSLAARLHEAAVAMTLISTLQLSLRDLAALDIARHLERDRQDRIRRVRMSGREALPPLGIDISLSEHTAARMERHLLSFRPLLPGAERSTDLFPGRDDRGATIDELRALLRVIILVSHPTTTRK